MALHFNLADIFECVADHVPDRDAVVYDGRRLTFAQLDERATRLAHHLQAHGVAPGDRVGLYLYNGNEYLEGALAAFKLRATPVNINFRYVEDELRYLFEDAEPAAVIYHREFGPRVAGAAPPSLRALIEVADTTTTPSAPGAVDYGAALAASSPQRDFPERSGDDLYLIYTGGTTGMPKGVMWRHEDVFFAGLQGGNPGGPPVARPEEMGPAAAARTNAPVTLPVAPLMHGNGHWSAMIGLHGGGKVALCSSRRLDPHEVWRLVQDEKVSIVSIVGDAMARPLADALEAPDAGYDTSSLMVLTSAGALFSEDVKDRLRAKLGGVLLIDAFGMSEAGHQGMNLGPNADGKLRFSIEPNTAVLDEQLRRLPPGTGIPGMLARTGRLPLGYWKDAEKSARTFVTDPDGVRWVTAGDMALLDADGTVVLLGRGSLCINSGGEKIYPDEVEAALKAHPDVVDAVVVGVPDQRWGERVAAVVQARAGAAPALDALDAHCRDRVAGYKVPRVVHFVDYVQRTPSGKTDYKWARAVALERTQVTAQA
jgi:acyl-CoA synthetase (AMP-forming)/AMP-acid ligase II